MSPQPQQAPNGSGPAAAPSPGPARRGVVVGRVVVVSPNGDARLARVWSLDSTRIVQTIPPAGGGEEGVAAC